MTVSDQIISVLDALCEKFGIVLDWSQQNVLPYIQELAQKLVSYEVATSVAWIVIMLSLTGILFLASKRFHKKAISNEDGYYDWDEANAWLALVSWIVFGCVAFASVFVICHQIFDVVTCLTFPEKVIMDYITNMMK